MSSGRRPDAVRLNKVLPRVETTAERGLTREQARERYENGYANISPDSPEKTVAQILRDNICTYFNLIFILLAICVIAVGSYSDLTFMPVVIANCLIGIIQELRSKRALSKLTLVTAPRAAVIRDRELVTIPSEKAVLDDVAVFSSGNQIYADAIVLSGECQVNEALVTGEADEITKIPGDTLLSGSFVVTGECRARLDKVGLDSFVSQLTLEAKKAGKRKRSGMMSALRRLVQIIGIIIIPFGVILFLQQHISLGRPIDESVVSTVAALLGMIPEGLYLLVSVALTVSIMRLAQRRTLVHEMGCIETLARVDVLCVDKTGTITESRMDVKGTALLCEDRFNLDDISMIMADYIAGMSQDNDTMAALREYFTAQPRRRAKKTLPFSSATKYGGVSFGEGEAYLLGAPEKILLSDYDRHREEIERYSQQGYRVLLLAMYDGDIAERGINGEVFPLALVYLSNRIRPEAPPTFRFFAKQNVRIVVISGDNPVTVSQIAGEAGIEGAERYIDASTLTTERKLTRAVEEYNVFGRVTPDQKRKLVRALKAMGHTVAMTGDGVNDVLALKDADCSIAMASGSDVASQVSNLVLLDSNFGAMPAIVMEGRRVINNIERSASLFLVKNIFSFLLAAITMALALPYPLSPSQLSLFNVMLIGIPSFVLALEPNKSIVRGKFLVNVILKALPAGLTSLGALLAVIFISARRDIPMEQTSTMATLCISFIGFMMLYKLGRPLNSLRIALIVSMLAGFALGGVLFNDIFKLVAVTGKNVLITLGIAAASVPVMLALSYVMRNRAAAQPRVRRPAADEAEY